MQDNQHIVDSNNATRILVVEVPMALTPLLVRWQNDKINHEKSSSSAIRIPPCCIVTADTRCRRRRPEYFSKPLVQRRLLVSILRGQVSDQKRGRERTRVFQSRLTKAGISFIMPDQPSEVKDALATALKNPMFSKESL